MTSDQMRVLVLSRAYPNNVMEVQGLWVRSQVQQLARSCELKVVSPVPYCPPFPGLPDNYARMRRVERRRWDGGIECFHPRMIVGPGASTYTIEWLLYLRAVSPVVRALRAEFPFDLIHAQFTYPDGVVATHLGRRFGVPVVITEQNIWGPWMNRSPSVCRRALEAARESACYVAISEAVRSTYAQFAGNADNLTVIPDGVEGSKFTLPQENRTRVSDQILFAGAIRPVKGVDVLLRAVRLLGDRGRRVRLVLVGEAFFKTYRQEEARLRLMVEELGIGDRVQFAGKQPLAELVRYMQESAALVLPSRAESLGMVLIEALACGTPVVATRCGGPEDIVTDDVGVLVQPDNPEALADGIAQVLDRRGRYDRQKLRAYALDKFSIESVGERLERVYREAVANRQVPARAAAADIAIVN